MKAAMRSMCCGFWIPARHAPKFIPDPLDLDLVNKTNLNLHFHTSLRFSSTHRHNGQIEKLELCAKPSRTISLLTQMSTRAANILS